MAQRETGGEIPTHRSTLLVRPMAGGAALPAALADRAAPPADASGVQAPCPERPRSQPARSGSTSRRESHPFPTLARMFHASAQICFWLGVSP
jgi:hypothetical protein